VLRAQSEDDVEKAVLECVNHVACGGNSAEMLWDLEQCPSVDPAKFVRELVHSTLRDADKYMFPTLDEALVDRFITVYDKHRPFGTVIEDDDMIAELEAVIEGMRKTVQGLADVEVPKQTLQDVTKALRELDEKLAAFLPKTEKHEEKPEQKQEQPAMESEAPSPALPSSFGGCPAKIEKATDDDAMVSEDEKKPEPKAEEPKKEPEQQKPADSTEMVDDSQVVPPATRQDSCLLKINNISSETVSLKPKVEEVQKLCDALDSEALSKDPVSGLEKVTELQRQTRGLSETLMRALLALDALNANETIRPLRRNQVIEVQQLMDQLDQISAKLSSFASTLSKDPAVIAKKERESEASLAAHQDPVAVLRQAESKKEEKAKAPEPKKVEEEKKEEEERAQEEAEEKGEEEEEEEEEEKEEDEDGVLLREMLPLWKSMKLRPRFDQQQQREAYVLTAMIPGLNRDEINISQDQDPNDGSDELVVSGVRVPTIDEMKKMLRHIKQLQMTNRINLKTERGLKLALMQLGQGRYGTFEERFILPEDAIVDSVHATYDGGRLGIVIPRQKQRQPQYAPRYGSRYGGYPFGGFGGRGGFGGFPDFF